MKPWIVVVVLFFVVLSPLAAEHPYAKDATRLDLEVFRPFEEALSSGGNPQAALDEFYKKYIELCDHEYFAFEVVSLLSPERKLSMQASLEQALEITRPPVPKGLVPTLGAGDALEVVSPDGNYRLARVNCHWGDTGRPMIGLYSSASSINPHITYSFLWPQSDMCWSPDQQRFAVVYSTDKGADIRVHSIADPGWFLAPFRLKQIPSLGLTIKDSADPKVSIVSWNVDDVVTVAVGPRRYKLKIEASEMKRL